MNLFCFSPFRRLYPPLTRYLGLWQGNYKFETGKKGKGKIHGRRNRAAVKKVVGILEKLLAFKRDA